MGANSVFVDTNVLVYAAVEDSQFHEAASKSLVRYFDQGFDIWISVQIIREFLSSQTRVVPNTKIRPLSDIMYDIHFYMKWFTVAEETLLVVKNLLDIVRTIPVGGKQIHDANIVATMMAYGIPNLLTYNVDDFKRFSSYITILPPTV